MGGDFNILGQKIPPPQGGELEFLAPRTGAESLRAIISNICEKSSKSEARFQRYRLKRPFFSQKPYNVTTSNVFLTKKWPKQQK